MQPRTPIPFDIYHSCTLCPRSCGADRTTGTGFCGCGSRLAAARAALHHWEEPCVSGPEQGPGGSGTVFFSGCTLRCCFCQNWELSSENFGKELTTDELGRIFLNLQSKGACNINLVTPTQYLPHIMAALDLVRHKLSIPVVYNCGGYETLQTVKALKNYVDIWLPDFKYYDNRIALKYSRAGDYFDQASAAILQMIEQTGAPVWQEDSFPQENLSQQVDSSPQTDSSSSENLEPQESRLLKKGVIVRHMVLPGHKDDSIALLHWIKDNLPQRQYFISLLSQYTPFHHSSEYPGLNRRITTYEYNRVIDTAIELGLTQGFMQQKSSAKEEYTPPFNLEGLEHIE